MLPVQYARDGVVLRRLTTGSLVTFCLPIWRLSILQLLVHHSPQASGHTKA